MRPTTLRWANPSTNGVDESHPRPRGGEPAVSRLLGGRLARAEPVEGATLDEVRAGTGAGLVEALR